jgi:hypothetical protein
VDALPGGLGRPGVPPGCLPCAGCDAWLFDGAVFDASIFDGAVFAATGFEGAAFDCPAFTWTGFDFDLSDAGLRDFELDFFLEAMG